MKGLSVLLALSLSATSLVAAQVGTGKVGMDTRGPQFLSRVGGRLVTIEPARIPLLGARVDARFEDVTLRDALQSLAVQSKLQFAFSRDVAELDRRVRMDARGLTLAAALTELLFDKNLDVVITTDNRLAIVTRARREIVPAGTVRGTVVDSASRAPVAGVTVSVLGTLIRTRTGVDGQFALVGVPVGTQTVDAQRLGYRRTTRAVEVLDGQTTTIDFALPQTASTLDEMIVAGTVVETRRRETPVPVAVIEEEQIHTPSRARLDQVFRGDIPGIIGIEGSPNQAGTYLFVRGRASLDLENLVKVYVDGVELPTTALISSLDMQNVERIELLRGPQATTIYGSDASGGVLLVFTKSGALGGPRLSGSASVGTSASNFVSGSPMTTEDRLTLSGGGQGFTYSVGGSFLSSGAYVEQGDIREAGFNGRATFLQGPFKFSLTSMYSNRVIGMANPPGFEVLAPLVPAYGVSQNTDFTTTNQLLGASATYAPDERWQTNLTVGWNGISDRGQRYRPRRATPGDTTYSMSLETLDQLSARLNSTLSLKLSPGLTSTTTGGIELARAADGFLGADFYDRATEFQQPVEGTSFVSPEQLTNNQGYFAQEVLGLNDRLFLTGALRVEHNSNFGANEKVIWAPRAGVAYLIELGSQATLKPRAAFGTSLRPPRPGQTGGAASPFFVQRANPDLRPEVQRGFDAGFDLDVEKGALSLEATYFNQTAKDLIDQTVLSYADPAKGTTNVTQYQNLGKVGNRGLELGVRSRLGIADLTASYTYTKSDVKSLSTAYQGLLIPGDELLYVPRHTAGGTLAFNLPSFMNRRTHRTTRLELGATYIGSRRTEDPVGFVSCLYKLGPCVDDTPSQRDYWPTLPSFVKLRAGMTQPFSDRLAVFLNVDNLSNRQDGELLKESPSRGRAILFGARFGE